MCFKNREKKSIINNGHTEAQSNKLRLDLPNNCARVHGYLYLFRIPVIQKRSVR